MTDWKTIWESRALDPARDSVLARLMAADGFDSGFGNLGEAEWRHWVERVTEKLGVTPGASVFEVGCGAGAFVYPWYQSGCAIGGLDASETLLGFAREVMPNARLVHGEAAALDITEPYDFVISSGVFLYFPSLDYAREVLTRMVKKARHGIAILDVPDAARREEAMAMRRGFMDAAAYEAKYRGLDHLYIERDWFREALGALGLRDVEVSDQEIVGYANGAFRYNVFAR